ncbi:hypothetical protein C8Q78DRAFT_962132 [Trametes maxima]|nr:hypothetical protein C8Q78DRAFT_962132 [Trametes maxima]
MLLKYYSLPLAYASLSLAVPLIRTRAVSELNQDAFKEAHKRDDSATRAFTNSQLQTSDGRCVFIDILSGDFRANLLPLQVGACGSTDGEGWDVITKGIHNDQAGQALVVSSLSNGCVSFDPRRTADQVHVFSCGGRADGGGQVSNSQLFAFNSTSKSVTLSLVPDNQAGSCLTVNGDRVQIANCQDGNKNQQFTFTGTSPSKGASSSSASSSSSTAASSATTAAEDVKATGDATPCAAASTVTETATVTVTVTDSKAAESTTSAAASTTSAAASTTSAAASAAASTAAAEGINTANIPTANPTSAVPVSRAGGTLVPTAVAESHQFDNTAKRAFTKASIKAPDGRCLFIDPTAGDFRENLIPVQLAECSGSPNEQFDLITAGKHNNQPGNTLIVSSLTNGCISFDPRRPADDQVTVFSCGGRADGEGQTDSAQLVPFTRGNTFVWAPVGARNESCLVAGGNGRVVGANCDNSADQVFTIVQ